MRISINWLKEFVDTPGNTQEIADTLTMLGLEAEEGLDTSKLKDIIIGEVKECIKHPNADKLKLCQVYDGNKTLPVVCGAPNVASGQKIAFAPVGSILPGDFKIGKAKIRGEVSQGMICSESEMGISDEHDGIMILDTTAKNGSALVDYLNEHSASIELDITPNRPDCFSHLGVARDLAVKIKSHLKTPEYKKREFITNKAEDFVSVVFENADDCPRYVAGIVKNVKVRPSPEWLKNRLESIGQRPINNIVDISNYVMMEMGHPTHIFDYDKLGSKEILIRRGKKGEKITTLDEVERKLSPNELLITNGESPIAIAGIMGGLESAVTEATENILIESAYFDAPTIRKGAKALGMSTDASKRFERGADPNGAESAFWRVICLVEDVTGGEWVPGIVDPYPKKTVQPSVLLTRAKLDLLSGCEIEDTFIVNTLSDLGFNVNGKSIEWKCTPPSWRPDLEREVDLIEEVIRIFGYDNVPSKYHYSGIMESHEPDPHKGISTIMSILSGLGFTQVFNNSLHSRRKVSILNILPVKVMNPLSDTMSHLRTSLIQGLLSTTDYNFKNGWPELRLVEWGNVFEQKSPGFKGIVEKFQLSGIIHGNITKNSVHSKKSRPASFLALKGMVDALLLRLNIHNFEFKSEADTTLGFTNAFSIKHNGETIGIIGDISSKFGSTMNLDLGSTFGFQFDLNKVMALANEKVTYQSIATYPMVERDLNFVVNEEMLVGEINRTIINNGRSILKKVEAVNVFRHESVGKGKKAVAFNLVFQSSSKTLEDKDVNPVIDEIIRVVSKKYSANLR